MTTIATGGFSTSDGSVGHFDSALIDYTVLFFMLVGSLPFILYLQMLRGRPMALWRDEQARGFLGLVLCLIIAVSLWLIIWKDFTFADALPVRQL